MPELAATVLATDLDGTLLRSDGSLNDRTRAAIATAEEAGIVTVFVTARPPRWLDDLADAVGSHGVAICGNGAFVYEVAARRVVESHPFDPDDLAALVAELREALPGIGFAAEHADGMSRESGFADPFQEHYTVMDDAPPVAVGKLLARSSQLPADAFHRRVEEVVRGRAELGFSGAAGLAELTAPGVTKASGLSTWCAERGLGPDDVWAIGDMPNDLPMLCWAGRALAVANAHDAVLTVADEVVASNDDDGVATVLERLVEAAR